MKTHRIFAILATILFAIASAAPAWASGAVVLVSKENRIYNLILKGVSEELSSVPEVVSMGDADTAALTKKLQSKQPDILIAVGDEAAQWAVTEWKDSPLLLAGVVDTMLPGKSGNVAGVALNLPPDNYFKAIREFMPSVRRVGTIYSPLVQPNLGRSLQSAAARHGLQLDAEPASTNHEFVISLRKIEHSIDAFLVMFDPLVLTPEAFQYLTQFSLSQDVPLVVPAFVLLKSGGVLSLEVDYEALGRQAAVLAKGILAHKLAEEDRTIAMPDQWQVGVNMKIGRALKVKISPSALKKADRIYE